MKIHCEKKRNLRNGILFCLPWIIGFLGFQLLPLLQSAYYSFTEFNAIKAPKWVGFANYKSLLKDDLFYKSLANTAFYTVFSVIIFISLAMLLALLIQEKIIGRSFFRTVFFIPSIVPVVATTMIWIWIFDPVNGVLNQILKRIGAVQPLWLTDACYTKWAVLIIGAWCVGTTMVIFLAALKDIPKTLYEAAEVDGAGPFVKFFRISLPMMSHIVVYQIVLCMIASFQIFTQPQIIAMMTYGGTKPQAAGGPENSLLMYSIYLYQNAFVYLKMGKASAMAWILFFIVMAVTLIFLKWSKRYMGTGTGED